MLKGIPSVLTPELFKIMMEMGHGDELVLGDGNYPQMGQPKRALRYDGVGIPVLLDAILQFMPLDSYVDCPVILMAVLPDDPYKPDIWQQYRTIIKKYEPETGRDMAINRFDFYKRAADAYASVITGEKARYANIILKKGVIKG
jgi:L-fucose mutarotase